MGGIAGFLSFTSRPARVEQVENMIRSLRHRGPDGGDVVVSASRRFALGACRLDTAEPGAMERECGGCGPLRNEMGDTWLAFDGEIFNHRPVRHSLVLDGHYFRTKDGSEVALHAYEQYGLGFLAHIRGMYALALWDDQKRRLVLTRDRVGEKPLYYACLPQGLIFASEMQALLKALPGPKHLDPDGLAAYLAFGFVPPPMTLVRHVRKLRPGETLVAETDGSLRLSQHWRPLSDRRKISLIRAMSPERHVANLRTLLECSVADRLNGDSPIATALDGGPAAASVAAIAARLSGRKQDCVSVTLTGGMPSRSAGTDGLVDHIGGRHHIAVIDPAQAVGAMADYTRYLDEPVADCAAPLHWWMARHCREKGLGVMLTGLGGAELLLADPSYVRLRKRARWMAFRRAILGKRDPSHTVSAALPGLPLFDPRQMAEMISPSLAAAPGHLGHAPPRTGLAHDGLAELAFIEMVERVPGVTLAGLDRMTMAHGIEARSPFLDDQLLDYALAIPGDQRAGGRQNGHMLNRLAQNLIPALSLPPPGNQPYGNKAAMADMFKTGLGDLFAGRLDHWRLSNSGVISTDGCRALLARHRSGKETHHQRLWAVMVLCEWAEANGIEAMADDGAYDPLLGKVALGEAAE